LELAKVHLALAGREPRVLSRVGGTDRLEVGRTDRPRGPGLALVIEADERSARGRLGRTDRRSAIHSL